MATKWGMCGAGKISHDFTCALASMPDEHQLVAVAARDLDRAKSFAANFGNPKAYGSYEEMAKDPNIEVVYIGTIHTEHYKHTLLFLNHGKHVLCEKPACLNSKQLLEMTSLAREKKLFFMEAVWSRFFPVYQKAITELSSGAIGELQFLNINFAIPIREVARIKEKSLGGGGLMDIGIYTLHIAVFLFGRPDKVSVEGTLMDTGVDEAGCVTFKYNDGRLAQLSYSVNFTGANEAIVFGTTGSMRIPSTFWCPTELILPSGKVTFDLPKTDARFNFWNSAGLLWEAEHVRKCLSEGRTESPLVSLSHSEYMMGLTDQIRRELGVRYDADE